MEETENVLEKATNQTGERVDELVEVARESEKQVWKQVWSAIIWQNEEGVINASIVLNKGIEKVEDGVIGTVGPVLINEYMKGTSFGWIRKKLGEVL